MRRRHSKMLLRGKPGLIVFCIVAFLGIFIAYYVWSSSSVAESSSSRYKLMREMNRNGYSRRNRIIDSSRNKHVYDTKGLKYVAPPKKIVIKHPPQQQFPAKNQMYDNNRDHVILKPPLGKDKSFEQDKDVTPKLTEKNKEKSSLYVDPDPSFGDKFQNMHHIVHLDLKGAAPKMSYLKHILPLLRKLGATGLLVEYEDMFPYDGNLAQLAAENAYSKADITMLCAAAKQNNLQVIPLVQTLGHMEFVLKHKEYENLRENLDIPQIITPTEEKSYQLIGDMITQIMLLHQDVNFFHIGSDEVFDLGTGKSEIFLMKNKTKNDVFLQHVARVAGFVKKNYPKVQPIIWDDELRFISDNVIQKSGLANLVDLMVWCYIPDPQQRLPAHIWTKYKLFNGVWAASSFKGATGSAQFITDVGYHLQNHLGWIKIIKTIKGIKLRGVALTGWQRYDHFATLCELLPAALPSLTVCLLTIQNGGFNKIIHKSASKMLNCTNLIELGLPKVVEKHVIVTQDCSFPGSSLYYSMQDMWGVINMFKNDSYVQSIISGWLTDYHVENGFSSPFHLKALLKVLGNAVAEMRRVKRSLQNPLEKIYDEHTVEEWIKVNIDKHINDWLDMIQKAKSLLQHKTWSKRPLKSSQEGQGMGVGEVRNKLQNPKMTTGKGDQHGVGFGQKRNNGGNLQGDLPLQKKVDNLVEGKINTGSQQGVAKVLRSRDRNSGFPEAVGQDNEQGRFAGRQNRFKNPQPNEQERVEKSRQQQSKLRRENQYDNGQIKQKSWEESRQQQSKLRRENQYDNVQIKQKGWEKSRQLQSKLRENQYDGVQHKQKRWEKSRQQPFKGQFQIKRDQKV